MDRKDNEQSKYFFDLCVQRSYVDDHNNGEGDENSTNGFIVTKSLCINHGDASDSSDSSSDSSNNSTLGNTSATDSETESEETESGKFTISFSDDSDQLSSLQSDSIQINTPSDNIPSDTLLQHNTNTPTLVQTKQTKENFGYINPLDTWSRPNSGLRSMMPNSGLSRMKTEKDKFDHGNFDMILDMNRCTTNDAIQSNDTNRIIIKNDKFNASTSSLSSAFSTDKLKENKGDDQNITECEGACGGSYTESKYRSNNLNDSKENKIKEIKEYEYSSKHKLESYKQPTCRQYKYDQRNEYDMCGYEYVTFIESRQEYKPGKGYVYVPVEITREVPVRRQVRIPFIPSPKTQNSSHTIEKPKKAQPQEANININKPEEHDDVVSKVYIGDSKGYVISSKSKSIEEINKVIAEDIKGPKEEKKISDQDDNSASANIKSDKNIHIESKDEPSLQDDAKKTQSKYSVQIAGGNTGNIIVGSGVRLFIDSQNIYKKEKK